MWSDPGASRVLDYPAAQLFVVRARAVRPGTSFSEPDLEAVGRISRALGGMPLALELAAARAASVADMPSARPKANAPTKASPAPVVSTASTVGAATWTAVLPSRRLPHRDCPATRVPPFALACFMR